jgi:hypothetical protein
MASEMYAKFQSLVHVVQGTKICEGSIWETLLFQAVEATKRFSSVVHGQPIALLAGGSRKNHKVDIFCKDDTKKEIYAFNSKGKSFNNTESGESLLAEYKSYKAAIVSAFPGYSVVYAILKDEFDPTDGKMVKYNFLAANGIPVYNTANYLQTTLGVSTDAIETARQSMVMALLKQRFKESGLSIDQVSRMLSD